MNSMESRWDLELNIKSEIIYIFTFLLEVLLLKCLDICNHLSRYMA